MTAVELESPSAVEVEDPHPIPLPEYRERGPEGPQHILCVMTSGLNTRLVDPAPKGPAWGADIGPLTIIARLPWA